MKGRVIAIDASAPDGIRAALMVDGQLEDFVLLPNASANLPTPGEIRVVRVTRTLPNGRGAFADLGPAGEGFLRQPGGVKAGQTIAAQVASLPDPGKAVPLNTRLLFKGPRLILTPEAPGVNVSRRIGNEVERDRLTAIVTKALAGAGADPAPGVIIRSAARNAEDDLLVGELTRHLAAWRSIPEHLAAGPSLGRVLAGPPLARLLADWLLPLPDDILCDAETAEAIRRALLTEGDRPADGIDFWGDGAAAHRVRPMGKPLEASGADDALRALATPETSLPGGASMVVEATRALVAVDVNTGADFSPAAGLKANLAAARDLPRQLRLRGFGGQAVVDFAPMPKKDRRTLEEALKKAFRADPVETALIGWTAMGLFEMQRKRERRPLPPGWTP